MYDDSNLTAWHGPADRDEQPAATLPEAVRLCQRIAGSIDADRFSLFFLASQGEMRRLAPVFDDEFPGVSAFSKALSAKGLEDFTRCATDTASPAWWRPDGGRPHLSDPAQIWASEIASPLPGTSGVAFPVSSDRARSGLVVFLGDDMMIDDAMLCDTHARCFKLFSDIAHQRVQECAKVRPMSKREIECLRLTSNGLTSDEIATTLGLSVHTANQYLTNSTHKLDAVNRIHAVAKALRSGLIE